jgi:hypothetical protein
MQKLSLSLPDRKRSWRLLAIATTFTLLLLLLGATASMQSAADPAARKRPTAAPPSTKRTPIKLVPVRLTPLAQLIVDPNFEAGDPWAAWTTQTSTNFGTPMCTTALCGTGAGSAPPFSGDNWAWFGGIPMAENATVGQAVTIPTGVTASLTFQLRIGSVSSPFTDTLTVKVDGNTLQTFTEPAVAEAGYSLRTINLNAFATGTSHAILFSYVGPTSGTANFTVDPANNGRL